MSAFLNDGVSRVVLKSVQEQKWPRIETLLQRMTAALKSHVAAAVTTMTTFTTFTTSTMTRKQTTPQTFLKQATFHSKVGPSPASSNKVHVQTVPVHSLQALPPLAAHDGLQSLHHTHTLIRTGK